MSISVEHINPAILVWARRMAGLSIGDVAKRLNKDETTIERWETGEESPTYPQLERLAYQMYKRPLAVFFFPEPPDEESPEHSFRTLPGFEIESIEPRVRYLRREALAMQGFLRELNHDENPSWLEFKDQLENSLDVPLPVLAAEVRERLGITLERQFEWRSTIEALGGWRESLENAGVAVFKEAFDQNSISGFCLYDSRFPIVYLNNSTSKSRQCFSLLHELAHLLAETGGITVSNDQFIDSLPPEHRKVEVFCNKFAAEVLVPSVAFRDHLQENAHSDATIGAIARRFSVSREVVLRKFLDAGKVSRESYRNRVSEWNREYLDTKNKRTPGGNYYATLAAYLGLKYLRLTFGSLYRGEITHERAARYLKVKPDNLGKLEDFYFSKMGS